MDKRDMGCCFGGINYFSDDWVDSIECFEKRLHETISN